MRVLSGHLCKRPVLFGSQLAFLPFEVSETSLRNPDGEPASVILPFGLW